MKLSLAGVCELITDGTHGSPKRTEDPSGYPLLSAKNILDGDVTWENFDRVPLAEVDEFERRLRLQSGDVLMTCVGSIGRAATWNSARSVVLLRSIAVLRPRATILSKYLEYAIRSPGIQRQLKARTKKSSQGGVYLKDIKAISIDVPPLAEQERIVRLLDEADAIRKLRAQADQRTADLIPAMFYEMFGDPVSNSMDWQVRVVEELLDHNRSGVQSGPFGAALKLHEYQAKGIPVWGVGNVSRNEFTEVNPMYISETKFDALRRYDVVPGDVLISRAGTVGRMCVARPPVSKSIISTNLIRVSLDSTALLPDYFTALLTYFPEQAGSLRSDMDVKAYSFLNPKTLRRLRVSVPPMRLQEVFVERIAAIRSLQDQQAQSKVASQANFDAILQSTFS